MKANIRFLVILISLIVSTTVSTKQASAQQADVSFQIFYDQLSPYGQWVDFPNYGYVWMPDAEPDFTPYSTNGYWIMTEYGMTWVSNYSWGWAPFHYGRWNYDDYYGWFWVPDSEWGPAWVTWRNASGYYGWEPMRPGISITLSFGSHYDSHYDHWIFVRDRDIDRPDIHNYYINRHDHDRIIRNSTVISNTYIDNSHHSTYVSGPRRDDLHRHMGRDVRTATIHENNSPGQDFRDNQLHLYRPEVKRNDDKNGHHSPTRISSLDEMKQHRGNNSVNQNHPDNNNRNNQNNVIRPNDSNRNKQENNNRINDNNRNKQENINRTNDNNRNKQEDINRTNENNRIKQENINRTNENNRNKQENINRSNENNRNKQENVNKSNDNNRNKQENVNRSNNNNQNQQQNNKNLQNRNNNNTNPPKNNRNEKETKSKSEKDKKERNK